MSKAISFLFVGILIVIYSCGNDQPIEPENSAPKIQSVTSTPDTIIYSGSTTLTCIANDKDLDILTYTWFANEGTFPQGNSGASVKFDILNKNESRIIEVKVDVSDGKHLIDGIGYIHVFNNPSAPILEYPARGLENLETTINFKWNENENADSYSLRVYKKTGNGIEVFYETVGLTVTSYEVSGLDSSTIYYWKVGATNSAGTTYSNESWFGTLHPPCPGTVIYGGKTYNTVQIWSQCWLQKNLDIGIMIYSNDTSDNQTDNGILEKYCCDNNPSNCDVYGGLYQWGEAMQYVTMEGAQGICPVGWHIPTVLEFEELKELVSGNSNTLKAIGQGTGSGAGINTSGFSALLAGLRYDNAGEFINIHEDAWFWSSTEPRYVLLRGTNDDIFIGGYNRSKGYSIRCIKD